jgi:multiple sugar transport system permease protein
MHIGTVPYQKRPVSDRTLLRLRPSRSRRRAYADAATYAVLVIVSLLSVVPIAWGLMTSLKPDSDIAVYPPQWLPHRITLQHYTDLLSTSGVGRFFVNSLILSLGTICLCILVGIPAGYAVARFSFRGRNIILIGILAASMLPGISTLIPIFIVGARLGLVNNYFYLTLIYSAWLIPQSVWLIKNFIEAVPPELDEAAMIDGCSRVSVLVRIIAPLIRPGLAAVAVLIFLFVWNDFLIGSALTTREDMRTVQVGLVRFMQNPAGVWWGQFMAFAMLSIAPVLAMFFFLQRHFVEGLTSGGVKG